MDPLNFRDDLFEDPVVDRRHHLRGEKDRVAELERKIGRQAVEIDFLKRALRMMNERTHRIPIADLVSEEGRMNCRKICSRTSGLALHAIWQRNRTLDKVRFRRRV